jgi:phosphopantothenoylcysteine synthetase/decarboxylase
MKILVTAGSTRTMIDQVRCISNIFKGRTGADIATYFHIYDHDVTLLTSSSGDLNTRAGAYYSYNTYEELMSKMKALITEEHFDVIIHSAAVSDYKVEDTLVMEGDNLMPVNDGGKVRSDHPALYLKLVPTEKIIDKIRSDWNFKGILVKFKLQVGMGDEELIEVADESRVCSRADIIVANCLEWCGDCAIIIGDDFGLKVKRNELPTKLLKTIKDMNHANMEK